MRRLGLALLLLAAAGCDRVFGLERDESCPYTRLDPDADDDRDSVLNGVDACPLIADQEAHDEDADGTPDACDPCPILAMAGADDDCDGIGAACDPDDTVVHSREFLGFGSSAGLAFESDAAVAGDAVQFTFPNSGSYGRAFVMTPVEASAIYEIHSRFTALDERVYCQHGLMFRDTMDATYDVLVARVDGIATLSITDINNPDPLASQEVGVMAGTAELTLRVEIVGKAVTARVTAAGLATTEVTATVANLGSLVKYGVTSYCDSFNPQWRIDVSDLTRTALVESR